MPVLHVSRIGSMKLTQDQYATKPAATQTAAKARSLALAATCWGAHFSIPFVILVSVLMVPLVMGL